MTWTSFLGCFTPSTLTRRPAALSPHTAGSFKPRLECLEGRDVPSATSLLAPSVGPALVAPAINAPLLAINNINVTNVAVTGANSLLATLSVTGAVAGKQFTLNNVQVPINTTIDTSGPSPILHLSLQIPDLNVLGLHVQLDNCHQGPVTVDITAIPSSLPGGGLLGDLLTGLNGALGSGGLLGLTGTNLTGLTGAIQDVLNGTIGQFLGNATTTVAPSHTHQPGGHQCDLVNLHLNPINLNVLGLEVATSEICLDVYAVRGSPNAGGGLLGNLLCGLDGLLSNSGNANGVNTLATRLVNILNGLTL